MTHPDRPLVVIGVGSVLRSDDAVGPRVVEGLRDRAARDPHLLPAATELVDGGTLGLDLLRVLPGSRGLLLVDAVSLGAEVGTVSVLHGDAIVAACGSRDGRADGAVGELIAFARLMDWLPEAVALVGIEVADTAPGTDLSPEVDGALPAAIDAVILELRRMDELPATGMQGGVATGRMAGTTA
jgi:hydrogenase maturation protease